MPASPPDLWPAKKIVEPDGTVRFVLKDGTEIHRLPPPEPVYDYTSGRSSTLRISRAESQPDYAIIDRRACRATGPVYLH
jgi:hypothetical protein